MKLWFETQYSGVDSMPNIEDAGHMLHVFPQILTTLHFLKNDDSELDN